MPNLDNRGNTQNQIVNGALETGGPRIKDPLFVIRVQRKEWGSASVPAMMLRLPDFGKVYKPAI